MAARYGRTPAEMLLDPFRGLNAAIYEAAVRARARNAERVVSSPNVTAEGLAAQMAIQEYVRG